LIWTNLIDYVLEWLWCHLMWVRIMSSRKLWTIWIGQVRTLMYFDIYIYIYIYIYCGVLVLLIQILQQSQTYNLYLRERTISPNCLKNANTTSRKWRMLFIKDYDFIHTRNLRFSNFKRRFFQQLNMKISQEPQIWRRVWR